ncbi:hypothetical protein ACSV4D_09470 [Flavobacterium sp. ARAG 55.4]|uniref:hypothetical protein n=1 Tax=Flavobacterium sp. ARAG 55.4 TaxID=3451357 RepID=UPI003F44CE93
MSEVKKNVVAASIADVVAKKVTEYFEKKDSKDEVYSTADGFVFENLVFAKNYAETLDDKTVTPHSKGKNIKVVDAEELTVESYQLTDADKELLQSGLESKNYNAMKALAKNLKLASADLKAETLIAVLTGYKELL